MNKIPFHFMKKISHLFNKNVFKKNLKKYGLDYLEQSSNYVSSLNEYIPNITDAILKGELIINSCNDKNVKNILREPEIAKAILNSPYVIDMSIIFKYLNIDVNTLNDKELTTLVNVLYNEYQYNTNDFKTHFNKYLTNPLVLKKTMKLGYNTLMDLFTKDAYTDEVIIAFCDDIKNKDGATIERIINREKVLYEYHNYQNFNHPYFINTLYELLNNENLEETQKIPIMNFYLELAIQNEDFECIKKGINFIKKQNLYIERNPRCSPFLLKSLILLNEIEIIEKMNITSFTKENINLLYENLPFDKFIKLDYINKNLIKAFEQIDIVTKNEYLTIFNYLMKMDDQDDIKLLIIKKYNNSNLNDQEINNIKDYILSKITNTLNQKYNDSNLVNTFIENVLNGKTSHVNLRFINNYKNLYVATYIADINSIDAKENIDCLPLTAIEKTNKKHIKEIISYLDNIELEDSLKTFLAYKIYLSIGYERARDLLNPNPNKNYGKIDGGILNLLFKNIDAFNVSLKKEGNGYTPILNQEWIKLIFGENYKIKNTPIRNYLNNFQDKQEEIAELKKKINNNLELTPEEKVVKEFELDKQYEKYKREINNFVSLCSTSFNEWDIITEEFIKNANKNKLKTKLNIAKVNEILKLFKNKRNLPELDIQDDLLINSDVFEYVGHDNQFTVNPEKAPTRAVNISRKMNNYRKKFPNITITKDNLTLYVYNPQDRRILSAGYRSACCFRPNGNADNHGEDNSLLNYCATNEYGGGLEIKDENGNTIMFSPILRNGNVLMIHSIESKVLWTENTNTLVHTLLKEYANKTILESTKNNDNIEFVAITNLHYLDTSYTIGSIPALKKFNIYDPENKYNNMYHNLDCEQFLLAKKDNKYIEDIKYNEETKSYDYPKHETYLSVSITSEELQMITKIKNYYEQIILLSNKRHDALKNNNETLAYELLEEINEEKSKYLKEYQNILNHRKGRDLYQEYHKAITSIERINKELKININDNILDINMGVDWYIAFDEGGKLYANALPSGEQKLKEELKKYQEIRKDIGEVMKL